MEAIFGTRIRDIIMNSALSFWQRLGCFHNKTSFRLVKLEHFRHDGDITIGNASLMHVILKFIHIWRYNWIICHGFEHLFSDVPQESSSSYIINTLKSTEWAYWTENISFVSCRSTKSLQYTTQEASYAESSTSSTWGSWRWCPIYGYATVSYRCICFRCDGHDQKW